MISTAITGSNTLRFLFVGYVDDIIYVPPLPQQLHDLKEHISGVELTNEGMLELVWQEVNYRLDICRVIQFAHIQHL